MKDKIFEESVARIEEIVSSLEKGELSLTEALQIYEEGTALVKKCTQMLNQAEQKVMELHIDESGEPVITKFGDEI